MRERRHQSGNSNTPRPASAHCESISPRSSSGHASLVRSSSHEKRGGAATARRAEKEHSDGVTNGQRRIHSARGERPVAATATAAIATTKVPRSPRSPRNRRPHSAAAVAAPTQELPRLVLNPLGVSGSGGAPVQWALKVSDTSEKQPPVEIPAHLQSILQDFSALLRDRYDGKRSLRLAFLNWDRDKDGKLSTQEIREMIQTLGLSKKLGRDSVDAILDHVASLPTQSLQYDDFCKYVYGINTDTTATTKPRLVSEPVNTSAAPASIAAQTRQPDTRDDVVLSSDRALYPDVAHIVNLLRTKYESRPLRSVFRHWDADKDGCITLAELDLNLRRQGLKLPSSQLQELFAMHDVDHDGRIKYQAFVTMIYGPIQVEHHNPALQAHLRDAQKRENQAPDPYLILKNAALENPARRFDEETVCAAVQQKLSVFAPRIHDAYSAFDDNHDGNLSYVEFREGLDTLGLHFSEREFLHLTTIVDTDGSGEISFKEFSHMFHRPAKLRDGPSPEDKIDHRTRDPNPELLVKQQVRLSQGTFDFSHLARRAKVPTRHGRTPYLNTKDLLSSSGGDQTDQKPQQQQQQQQNQHQRFRTETSLYGSGQKTTPRSSACGPHKDQNQVPHDHHLQQAPPLQVTLGQEEKQRKDAQYGLRLERIRQAKHEYDSKTIPGQSAFDTTQQRRVDTLHRHQQRYQSSIEEHRPQQPQYSPQAAYRARQLTRPPYIND